MRPPRIQHCTSLPFRFFGRSAELALLDQALCETGPSVLALVGPGGQGKTAIVQHWLAGFVDREARPDGVFLWSFYRGKDADLCIHDWYAYAEGFAQPPELSASYCVDRLLAMMRREHWVVVLDGTEVVQYDAGPWIGRFIHPELGRLLEELASKPLPGLVVVTTRLPLLTLQRRTHARLINLGCLDSTSARDLLRSHGVRGSEAELSEAAVACGLHAKAVELLGTYLARYQEGSATRSGAVFAAPPTRPTADPAALAMSDEERGVVQVLAAHQNALPSESQDILALATAFRDPPGESRLVEFLASQPVRQLLHETWCRNYAPFAVRGAAWLANQVDELVKLRLLERVGRAGAEVIDAHPLVRRGFQHVLGTKGQQHSAQARAGFLRGRPDRRRAETLDEARADVELFHAYCDAGLWNEADGTYLALENPKHRFLVPAFERDMLRRFFADGDWTRPPLWPGFGHYRSIAICLEMLGQFDEALALYRSPDVALRGDALIALGSLEPLVQQAQAPHPWQALWQAYRAHALCLAGRMEAAMALARSLVPVDIYEWVHIFECLLRAGQLARIDLRSLLYRPPHAAEHRWAELARQRMRADYVRVATAPTSPDLGGVYEELAEAYDRGGLPFERALVRLSHARYLLAGGQHGPAGRINVVTQKLARRYGMRIVAVDALLLAADVARAEGDAAFAQRAASEAAGLRRLAGYEGPARP
jgi:hypothetical protein